MTITNWNWQCLKNTILAIILCANVCIAQESETNKEESSESNTTESSATTSTSNLSQSVDLGILRVVGENEAIVKYQSGSSVELQQLESAPSGNGDITSALKILPNIQYDNTQNSSNTPGEIDPANISISGGLYYQNLFIVDGMGINNDLDPVGGTTNGPNSLRGNQSQGLNIDISLIESINVQDSNISAKYGGFSGGVVEANTKKPDINSWHWNFSWQYTSSDLTKYHIDDDAEANFATSSDENYQPNFTKHIFRASANGYITDNFGILASYSTTRSQIPLTSYNINNGYVINDASPTRNQHRISDNYYLKAYYNPIETLLLEATVAYMPQDNTYFSNIAKDSYYKMKSGGVQAGLKATWDTEIGDWINQLSYSLLETSRRSESNYYFSWYASDDKNWAVMSNTAGDRVFEGGYGDIDQLQNTISFKSDFEFLKLNVLNTTHSFNMGLELEYATISKERLNNYYIYNLNDLADLGNNQCVVDSFGFLSCSTSSPYFEPSWSGQYFTKATVYELYKVKFDTFSYGYYLEDDTNIDFGDGGEINARLGFRFDGDSYMKKHTVAPRFSINYVAPWDNDYKTILVFGANRYYGRNLFSYRLYDVAMNYQTEYKRDNAESEWVVDSTTTGTSSYRFDRLKVPYNDEFMTGFTQHLWNFTLTLKYIYRKGNDEIMQVSRSTAGASNLDDYSSSYTVWTNDGNSKTNVISLILQNEKALEIWKLKNYFMIAFDWTDVRRSYNIYNTDSAYYNDDDILVEGKVMKYRDRPVDNYTRPWTLRFNTLHTFEIGKAKLLWNNLFRYRAAYTKLSSCTLSNYNNGYCPWYDTSRASEFSTQYGKMKFNGAFTWDMRIGAEFDFFEGNTFYVNFDILNILNMKNVTSFGNSSGNTSNSSTQSIASYGIPIYEIGRQVWIQVGYKY